MRSRLTEADRAIRVIAPNISTPNIQREGFARLPRHYTTWLRDNCQANWTFVGRYCYHDSAFVFSFADEGDAILFAIMSGGKVEQ